MPVIREEDPQAKVVLAPVVLYFGRDWLFTLLDSDVIQLFDVIDWHPFYDAAPDLELFGIYYYDYPSIIHAYILDTDSDIVYTILVMVLCQRNLRPCPVRGLSLSASLWPALEIDAPSLRLWLSPLQASCLYA